MVEEGERGIREKEEVFWKLHKEYSQEEVEKHLEAARSSSRSGSPVAMLMDGELTDEDVAVSSSSCKRQKIALASTPAAAGTGQGSEEEKMLLNIQRVLYINLARRPDRDQALDMQAVTAAIAGYFSGYTSKMQPIEEQQIKQLREAIERKVAGVDCKGCELG